MEDILASIKKVIAEEKEQRGAVRLDGSDDQAFSRANDPDGSEPNEVLELDEPLAPPIDLGPPLIDETTAGQSRHALDQLSTIAATVPAPPPGNPLEEMVREMLRPVLKQWLDEHLPQIVQEHVKREITRITGRPV
jgi:cell pole-organizing protein PopZ